MSAVLILNGPNVGLIGHREPHLYGSESLDTAMSRVNATAAAAGVSVEILTSNYEAELVDRLHKLVRQRESSDIVAVIVNPGGATAYGIALLDALRAIRQPIVEVHVSNRAVKSDGDFRQRDPIAAISRGLIAGFGTKGYDLAMEWCLREAGAAGRRSEGAADVAPVDLQVDTVDVAEGR